MCVSAWPVYLIAEPNVELRVTVSDRRVFSWEVRLCHSLHTGPLNAQPEEKSLRANSESLDAGSYALLRQAPAVY